ncbi:hypothetical protein ACX1C1_20405 [Paenibacillus sp. strain BS8-2]
MKPKWSRLVGALLAWIIIMSGSVLIPKQAYACSCMQPVTVEEEKERSDAIFDGTVISSNKPKSSKIFSSADSITWTFEAHEVWKGEVTPIINVASALSSTSCGYEFQEGKRYLVYAHMVDGSLEASFCSRTALQTSATTDINEFGKGAIPDPVIISVEDDIGKPFETAAADNTKATTGAEVETTTGNPSSHIWLKVSGITVLIAAAVMLRFWIKRNRLRK